MVFSIVQEVSLGDGDVVRKNFYINMGQNQGVREGILLDVFRVISQVDPYQAKKRYNFKVKVGELQVIHSEDDSAIAVLKSFNLDKKALYLEVEGIMIGDHVAVNIDS